MLKRARCLVIVASVVLLGCAAVPAGGGSEYSRTKPPPVCHGTCQVEITCAGSPCTLEVEPEVLLIDRGGPGQKIMFSVRGGTYDFVQNGIDVQNDPANPDDAWKCQSDGKRKYLCESPKYRKPLVFKYTVKVAPDGHPDDVVEADPWIVNN